MSPLRTLALVLLLVAAALPVSALARHIGGSDATAPAWGDAMQPTLLVADERALDALDASASALLVPAHDGELPEKRAAAIARFARSGGNVIVLGDDAAAAVFGFALYPGTTSEGARPVLAPAQAEVLLQSSDAAFVDVDGDGVLGAGDARGPFVVAARSVDGRATILGVAEPASVDAVVQEALDGRAVYLDAAPRGPLSPAGAAGRVALDLREPLGLGGATAALVLAGATLLALSRREPAAARDPEDGVRLRATEGEG